MMKIKLLTALVGTLLATVATAHPVYVKFDGVQDVVRTAVKIDHQVSKQSLGTYNFTTADTANGDNARSFTGFCVDPYQFTSSRYSEYKVSSLDPSDFINAGQERYNAVQKLFDNAYGSLNGDNAKTAGFHLALWEIFVDNGDTGSNSIQTAEQQRRWWWTIPGTDAAVKDYADTFLASLDDWDITNEYDFTFYKSHDKQDYLEAYMTPSAVPVPAALPLMASALGMFGIARRRKA